VSHPMGHETTKAAALKANERTCSNNQSGSESMQDHQAICEGTFVESIE
jgi:hypothetical protein